MAKWPRETSAYANDTSEGFKDSLKGVAESFANHERVDSVSKKHVDDSFFALARVGLQRPKWYHRSDTWTALGAFLVGISFSMPDVCSVTFEEGPYRDTCSVVLLVALLAIGSCLVVLGKASGSIPRIKPQ
jgi:hypothetical protein